MSQKRFISLLIAALLVLACAFYLSSRRNPPSEAHGTVFLPTLAAELDSISEVTVRKGSATPTVTLHKAGDQWLIAERGDYPAAAPKLRKLLIALGDAKITEEKTSDPANYALIGVEDPTAAGAAGAEVRVTAKDGKHAVIIGKPVGEGDFVRRVGEAKSFIVEPAIPLDSEARSWIDPAVLDIQTSAIQNVAVKPATGAAYTLKRLKPNEDGFSLDGAPAGRTALDAKALAPSSSGLSGLTAEDVAAVGTIDFGKADQATVTLADGNTVTITGAQVGDKRWIQLKAAKDGVVPAKAKDRAFEVASYRYDAIFRPLEQLLVPKETKPAAGAVKPAVKSAPTPKP